MLKQSLKNELLNEKQIYYSEMQKPFTRFKVSKWAPGTLTSRCPVVIQIINMNL